MPENLAVDARAKIMWGETPASVHAYLVRKLVKPEAATVLIAGILEERAAVVRSEGLRELALGVPCLLAPGAYYLTAALLGSLSLKLLSVLLVVGIYGVMKTTKGASKFLRPRSNGGDLSNAAW